MTRTTAADRHAPLTDDLLLEERIAFLLRRAGIRQVWMLFLGPDDVQSDVVMPCDDLPADPLTMTRTDDLGSASYATVLAHRVRALMDEFGLAQAVFVWERPGGATARRDEQIWARALAAACADRGVRVRAQFLLHDEGVRRLAPDDVLDAG